MPPIQRHDSSSQVEGVDNHATLIHPVEPVRGIVPRLLRRRTVTKMVNLYRFLHLVRSPVAQITRLMFCTLRSKGLVLRFRPGNDGDGVLRVEFMHCVVPA